MKKKIFSVLLVLLMATVSVSFAAVTVTIDNLEGKAVYESVSIPVNITGFDEFLAGEFVFDFGDTALKDITITAGALCPNGFEDYSAVAVLQDMIDKNGWEETKDAAIDYEVLGSKVKIYLYAPYATSEVAGGVPDGVLFNINGTVGAGATSGILNFGGKVFNASLSTRKIAPVLHGSAPLVIGGIPIEVINDFGIITDTGNVIVPIDMKAAAAADPGKVTVELVMQPTAADSAAAGDIKIEAKIAAGTIVTLDGTTPFTGYIEPPKPTKVANIPTELPDKQAKVKSWVGDPDAVFFTMGDPTVKLVLSQPMLLTLTVVRASGASAFKVYYLPENEAPVLAGIDGTEPISGKDIAKGGTYLADDIQTDAETGEKTYTVYLLLDHMSDYVVGDEIVEPGAAAADDDDACFINTAGFDSNSVGLLIGLMAMVMAFGCIGYYLKRKREIIS